MFSWRFSSGAARPWVVGGDVVGVKRKGDGVLCVGSLRPLNSVKGMARFLVPRGGALAVN